MAELKSSLKKNLDVKQMLSNSFKQTTNVSSSAPTQINDLSSLIKKRKSDNTPKSASEDKKEGKEAKEPETKKAKVEKETEVEVKDKTETKN